MKSKKYIKLALIFTLLSFGVHIYLTFHYYSLKFGHDLGNSVCNINALFDCDSVAASSYSAFLGIPLSIWGGMTNLLLLYFLGALFFRLTEHSDRVKRYSLITSGVIFMASIVMGVISVTQLSVLCLFCIIAYALSLLTFYFVYQAQETPFKDGFQKDLTFIKKAPLGTLVLLLFVPLASLLTHESMLNNYGSKQLSAMLVGGINDWKGNPTHKFPLPPSLQLNPQSQPKMIIHEFADMLCGHCKNAAPSLYAFAKSHPDVEMNFYAFPLDSTCNNAIKQGSGISCRLAKAVFCVGSDKSKSKSAQGWDLLHDLFKQQSEAHKLRKLEEVDQFIKTEFSKKLSLDITQLISCMDNPDTLESIRAQAQLGEDNGVEGTPAIFVQGRLLPGGQLIPVLEKAYNSL